MEPHVDKIYIAYSKRPFGYIEKSRQTRVNPTRIEDIRAASNSNKIEIVCGDWATEEAMRNACLQRARAEGFDWFLIQDADEFYPESSWKQIKTTLIQNKSDDQFRTTWYNFWKSSHFVLAGRDGAIKSVNAAFAIRCSSSLNFTDRRLCNHSYVKIIDSPCYHYSYVMSDEEMAEKMVTWSHAHELFSPFWYTYKWLNWNESTRWLHPVIPADFFRAIHFPMEQPDFADQFSIPVNPSRNQRIPPVNVLAGDALYDTSVRLSIAKGAMKRIIKSMLFKNDRT